jgi:hypothetical protein
MKQLSEALFTAAEHLRVYLARSDEVRNLFLITQNEVAGLIRDACSPLHDAASIGLPSGQARLRPDENHPQHPWSFQIPGNRDIHLHALHLLIHAFSQSANPSFEIEIPITIDTTEIERSIQARKGFDPVAFAHHIDNQYIQSGLLRELKLEAAMRFFEGRLEDPLIEHGQILGVLEVAREQGGGLSVADINEVLRAIYTYSKYSDHGGITNQKLRSLKETESLLKRFQSGRSQSIAMLNTVNLIRLDDTDWFSLYIQ